MEYDYDALVVGQSWQAVGVTRALLDAGCRVALANDGVSLSCTVAGNICDRDIPFLTRSEMLPYVDPVPLSLRPVMPGYEVKERGRLVCQNSGITDDSLPDVCDYLGQVVYPDTPWSFELEMHVRYLDGRDLGDLCEDQYLRILGKFYSLATANRDGDASGNDVRERCSAAIFDSWIPEAGLQSVVEELTRGADLFDASNVVVRDSSPRLSSGGRERPTRVVVVAGSSSPGLGLPYIEQRTRFGRGTGVWWGIPALSAPPRRLQFGIGTSGLVCSMAMDALVPERTAPGRSLIFTLIDDSLERPRVMDGVIAELAEMYETEAAEWDELLSFPWVQTSLSVGQPEATRRWQDRVCWIEPLSSAGPALAHGYQVGIEVAQKVGLRKHLKLLPRMVSGIRRAWRAQDFYGSGHA